MTKIPITAEGLARLRDELRRLKSQERPAIIRAIEAARAHGDLSENAEYHAAKERQGFIEARVSDLEHKISHAQVIEIAKLSGERVQFGAVVRLLEEDSGEEKEFRIVGADEADIATGLLSVASPLARGLIGKRTGDEVEIAAPNGVRVYEILSVAYK